MGAVVPFPRARDRGFVARHAERMLCLSPEAGEAHLRQQLRVQREKHERKGVDPALISAELRQLEGSIRAEVWRFVMQPETSA